MQATAGIPSETSLLDPEILADRFPFYRRLRTEEPVRFDDKLGMYLVSRFEDIATILHDPVTFSMERGFREQYAKGYQDEWREILDRDGGGYFVDHIMSDPPTHTRVRKLLENAFTARKVKELEPRIRTVIAGILDGIADKAEAEAVRNIGVPITAHVICEQMGFDPGEIQPERIERWAIAINAQMGRMQSHEEMLGHAAAICDMQNTIIRHIRDRQANPRDDTISDFVHARIDDDENPHLAFGEVVSSVKAMIAAANDATAGMIVTICYILATEPELAAVFREGAGDDKRMNRIIEELIRREPPAHGTARMTTREVELGGVLLPEGAHVLMMFASANYDETQFPEPRRFDADRPNLGHHLGFGSGIHRCIGASLARMELKVFVQEALKRLDNFEVAVPLEGLCFSPTIATLTFERLPLRFTRKTAQEATGNA